MRPSIPPSAARIVFCVTVALSAVWAQQTDSNGRHLHSGQADSTDWNDNHIEAAHTAYAQSDDKNIKRELAAFIAKHHKQSPSAHKAVLSLIRGSELDRRIVIRELSQLKDIDSVITDELRKSLINLDDALTLRTAMTIISSHNDDFARVTDDLRACYLLRPALRFCILDILGEIGKANADVSALISLGIADEDRDVRAFACQTLRLVKDWKTSYLHRLEWLLVWDESDTVRRQSSACLRDFPNIEKAATPQIYVTALRDSDFFVRNYVLQFLKARDFFHPCLMPAICDILENDEAENRLAAIDVLVKNRPIIDLRVSRIVEVGVRESDAGLRAKFQILKNTLLAQ
jgi:hypothetical protein